jgi:MarR-like DNA-binding transcriptional regulator SgrR of sgrS sRNA
MHPKESPPENDKNTQKELEALLEEKEELQALNNEMKKALAEHGILISDN